MTSVLYPRLLSSTAHELYREFAGGGHSSLASRAAVSHPAAVFAATGGRRVTSSELEDLRNAVLGAAVRAGFPDGGRRQDRGPFDLEVARLLHQRTGLVAAEAAVRPVWAFVALVLLPDVSYWRFPDPPADRVIGTDITRHAWGRLWWRAHLLSRSEDRDRYALLDVFGEAAFDQIFARRRSIGGSRAVVRAMAELWPTVDRRGLAEREVLMDVLKRLMRLGALVEFEALDDDELRSQVAEATVASVAALSASGADTATPRHGRG